MSRVTPALTLMAFLVGSPAAVCLAKALVDHTPMVASTDCTDEPEAPSTALCAPGSTLGAPTDSWQSVESGTPRPSLEPDRLSRGAPLTRCTVGPEPVGRFRARPPLYLTLATFLI